MSYATLDSIPDLTPTQLANAGEWLSFSPYYGPEALDAGGSVTGYDLYQRIYKLTATAGAKYDILSISYYDPAGLTVYDQYGNAVATNDEATDPGNFLVLDVDYRADEIGHFIAPYTGTFYIAPNWRGNALNSFHLLSTSETRGQAVNGSDLPEVLVGTEFADSIYGFDGNDTITSGGGNDRIDGGGGIDVVNLPATLADYVVTRTGSSVTLVKDYKTITLSNVERVWAGGQQFAMDVDGHGGQAYRLYQAAFDRAPDAPGLGFQMKTLDDGWSLSAVAANFIASPEFQGKYGALDNAQFVTQLYANVLHRAPDSEGLAYHLDRLAHGAQREAILVGFSESPENQANVIGAIDHGMLYIG